jgi:hypothetical protein
MIDVFTVVSLLICIFLNILSSRFGFSNILTGDKDILLPFSAMIFLFFPLLIYLPEANYKFLALHRHVNGAVEGIVEEEEEEFPWAFLLTLLSVTACILLHRLVLFNEVESEEEALNRRAATEVRDAEYGPASNDSISSLRLAYRNIEYRIESQILKYYLSVAIGLLNIVFAFYITNGEDKKVVKN